MSDDETKELEVLCKHAKRLPQTPRIQGCLNPYRCEFKRYFAFDDKHYCIKHAKMYQD